MSMESNDESIKLLKKRMHQQMNVSSGKDIKPEDIQYYVSSLIMQKGDADRKKDAQQDVYAAEEMAADEKLKNGEKLSKKEDEIPRQKDPEYIRRSREEPQRAEGIKVPEMSEVQHERAKNEYEKVLRSMDEEELYGFRKPHWLNIKG